MQIRPPNCEQILRASMLKKSGARDAFIMGPCAILRPPEEMSAFEYAISLIKGAGLAAMDQVRDIPELPRGRWIIRVEPVPPLDFAAETEPLLCAAILGLSSTTFYSPNRPFVWTQDRLNRAISLHRLGDFYAA